MSRTQSILRRSSTTTDNPPFVPSPQWLTDSPARPPPSSGHGTPAMTHIERPEQTTPRVFEGTALRSPQQPGDFLRSPVPPPPPNLHPGGATAFNVDPGVPFLATAGSRSEGGSDDGSFQPESPTPKQSKFGGGLVTGLKRAVGSLKKTTLSSRSHSLKVGHTPYAPPHGELRDSGYGDSTQYLANATGYPGQSSMNPASAFEQHYYHMPDNAAPSHGTQATGVVPHRPHPGSAPVYYDDEYVYPKPYSPLSSHSSHPQTPGHMRSPKEPFSPVSATPLFGPDYAQMEATTPPPSEVSLNTYLSRVQDFVAKVAALPWIDPERPTVDYYPERAKRRDEPKHAPQISWRAPNYIRPTFKISTAAGLVEERSEAGTWDSYDRLQRDGEEAKVPVLAITPRRGSQVDLGEEFEEPLPASATQPGFTPRWKEQNLYGANTPAGTASVKLPLSRIVTPEQHRQPLTSPGLTPLAHPQPRYSSEQPFRPPPVLDDRASGAPTPRGMSRTSSRGYALYDSSVANIGGGSPARRDTSKYPASPGRMASIRAPDEEFARQVASPRRSQSGYAHARASGSISEQYTVRRTGYVPVEEAPKQAPFSHLNASRSGLNTPTIVPLRGDSRTPLLASIPFQ